MLSKDIKGLQRTSLHAPLLNFVTPKPKIIKDIIDLLL